MVVGTGIATLGMLSGNPAIAVGATYIGSTITSATSIASIAKYYRDGHKYVHKYD